MFCNCFLLPSADHSLKTPVWLIHLSRGISLFESCLVFQILSCPVVQWSRVFFFSPFTGDIFPKYQEGYTCRINRFLTVSFKDILTLQMDCISTFILKRRASCSKHTCQWSVTWSHCQQGKPLQNSKIWTVIPVAVRSLETMFCHWKCCTS